MSATKKKTGTGEMKAVGREINERLAALLKRLGVSTDEVSESYDRISNNKMSYSPLTPLPKLKDQSSTT